MALKGVTGRVAWLSVDQENHVADEVFAAVFSAAWHSTSKLDTHVSTL